MKRLSLLKMYANSGNHTNTDRTNHVHFFPPTITFTMVTVTSSNFVPSGRAICTRLQKKQAIMYMNTGVFDARIRGIYRHMLRKDYTLVKDLLNDTIYTLNTAKLEDNRLATMFIPFLYKALVELALKRYNNVHNILRDIHYFIVNARLS